MVWKQQPIYWIIEIIFTWNIFAPFLWALHCTGQSVLSPTKRPRVFHATCKSHVASESSYTVQLSLGQQGWKSCKDALEKTENYTNWKFCKVQNKVNDWPEWPDWPDWTVWSNSLGDQNHRFTRVSQSVSLRGWSVQEMIAHPKKVLHICF